VGRVLIGSILTWGYAKTARARDKIRAWFRKLDREKHISSGREVIEHELKRLSVEHTSYDSVAQLFHYDKLDDFLAAVGAGDINGAQIANKVLESERQNQQKSIVEIMIEGGDAKPVPSQVHIDTNGINIMGMGGDVGHTGTVFAARCTAMTLSAILHAGAA